MQDILIVDDNADIRRLLRATLEGEFATIEADNGELALDLIRTQHPKIVFLDVMMPGELNGLQVLSAIREDEDICDTLVVVVSARGQETDLVNAGRHGADGYIVKPFSTTGIREWVRKMLH